MKNDPFLSFTGSSLGTHTAMLRFAWKTSRCGAGQRTCTARLASRPLCSPFSEEGYRGICHGFLRARRGPGRALTTLVPRPEPGNEKTRRPVDNSRFSVTPPFFIDCHVNERVFLKQAIGHPGPHSSFMITLDVISR